MGVTPLGSSVPTSPEPPRPGLGQEWSQEAPDVPTAPAGAGTDCLRCRDDTEHLLFACVSFFPANTGRHVNRSCPMF